MNTVLSQELEECKAQLEAALAAAGEPKETPPDYIRRGCQSRLHQPGSKAWSGSRGEHKARTGRSSDRGCRQAVCHQFRGGECHEPPASPDNSSRRLFLPRGIRCLQFGRCVPPCRSKWSSQSHGAICKRHTGKKILVIIYIPVAPET